MNIQTRNVYQNFPNYTSKIKYPICFDYSLNDKYLCVGNDEGKALLYRLYNIPMMASYQNFLHFRLY